MRVLLRTRLTALLQTYTMDEPRVRAHKHNLDSICAASQEGRMREEDWGMTAAAFEEYMLVSFPGVSREVRCRLLPRPCAWLLKGGGATHRCC